MPVLLAGCEDSAGPKEHHRARIEPDAGHPVVITRNGKMSDETTVVGSDGRGSAVRKRAQFENQRMCSLSVCGSASTRSQMRRSHHILAESEWGWSSPQYRNAALARCCGGIRWTWTRPQGTEKLKTFLAESPKSHRVSRNHMQYRMRWAAGSFEAGANGLTIVPTVASSDAGERTTPPWAACR
jgi:2-polyprenyl-6-methoxyphenol hydroxylase-like FAD-dependent oxidoreductase